MSWYYTQNFVTPTETYAKVKEELKSYFDAGLVDDLLFPKWTSYCIGRWMKSALKIQEVMLFIDNHTAKLPPDFAPSGVREAWSCTPYRSKTFRNSGSFYQMITSQVSSTADKCQLEESDCCSSDCAPCATGDIIETVFKTNTFETNTYWRHYLLRPGNISALGHCDLHCRNANSSSLDSFDIRDGKFITNFQHGEVHLIYYSTSTDDEGNQLVPDNVFFLDYLEHYIKFKVFEVLSNTVVDETSNQIQGKRDYYEVKMCEKFVLAEGYTKKQTLQQKLNSIDANRRRLKRYWIR